MKSLFDICACKCKEEALCSCPKELKVPKDENACLVDQRLSRKMIIGSIERKKTVQLWKKRKQLDTTRKSKHAKLEEGDVNIETGRFDLTETDNDISSGEEDGDLDSSNDEPPCTKASSQIACNQNAQTGCLSLHSLKNLIDFLCLIELVLLLQSQC